MQYSFSTVLMAFLSSNLIIIFIAICFCNKDLLVSFGYKMFALLIGLTLIRFVFPFELPFTTNITLPDMLSQGIALFRRPFSRIGSFNVSMWSVFELIWLAGALVMLALFIKDHLVFHHWVVWQSINLTDDEHYSRLLDEICGESPNPFWVFELPGLKTPMLYGIRHPRILIPAGMELQEEELRYLLSHETAHHLHHDILIKLGVSLLTVVYWWNPACHVLKKQLDAVLEMRIDDYVTDDTFESKRGYLRCLVHVAEEQTERGTKYIKAPGSSIALFNPKCFNTLTHRFNMMSEKPKPYARFLHASALVLTVGVYLFSYVFIFEAQYAAPEEIVTTFEPMGSYTYLVQTADDTYEVYYGTLLLETVDSISEYLDGTPVYNSLDEVLPELRVDVLGEDDDIEQ